MACSRSTAASPRFLPADRLPSTLDCTLLRDLFGTARCARSSTRALLQGWLDAEAALARALADVGRDPAERPRRSLPRAAPSSTTSTCCAPGSRRPAPAGAARARARRAVRRARAAARTGARRRRTSSTRALVLQLREALAPIAADLARARVAAAALAERHAATPMAGRTHGQHAVPITFGLKAASWADELVPRAARARAPRAAALPASARRRRRHARLARGGRRAVREAYCRQLGLPSRRCPGTPRATAARPRPRARRDRRRGRADRRRDHPAAGHRDRRSCASPRRPGTSARRRCRRSGTR